MLAKSIYDELEVLVNEHGPDCIGNLMPLVVNILESLDSSLSDNQVCFTYLCETLSSSMHMYTCTYVAKCTCTYVRKMYMYMLKYMQVCIFAHVNLPFQSHPFLRVIIIVDRRSACYEIFFVCFMYKHLIEGWKLFVVSAGINLTTCLYHKFNCGGLNHVDFLRLVPPKTP